VVEVGWGDGVGVAEWAGPVEVAGVGLVECPPAVMFQSMVVAAEHAEVVHGGGSAFGPVLGVVEVGVAGGYAAAGCAAGAVAGLDVGGILRCRPPPVVPWWRSRPVAGSSTV
jgi:hypothetical protein